jgi:CBS domain-containing protein
MMITGPPPKFNGTRDNLGSQLMTSQRVSAIPVVAKGGRVVGVVSEADVLRKAERRSWR